MMNLTTIMSPGVWVVKDKPNCASKSLVAKVCELPEHPYDFASIMCNADDLCDFIKRYENGYTDRSGGYGPSRYELSLAILNFLAGMAGVKKVKQTKRPSRRIDLIL